MNIIISTKNNEQYTFRKLLEDDANALGHFFCQLSDDTRSKYGPHPLTSEHALELCKQLSQDNVVRFIVCNEQKIIGYFILDFNVYLNEVERYAKQNIEINSKVDPVLAPCIADDFQNSGIASQAMVQVINYAQDNNLRSIVLMGGTQEPNTLARSFYKKFNFEEYERFYTEHNQRMNIDMMLTLA